MVLSRRDVFSARVRDALSRAVGGAVEEAAAAAAEIDAAGEQGYDKQERYGGYCCEYSVSEEAPPSVSPGPSRGTYLRASWSLISS